MKENPENMERRDFFKKTVASALPALAATLAPRAALLSAGFFLPQKNAEARESQTCSRECERIQTSMDASLHDVQKSVDRVVNAKWFQRNFAHKDICLGFLDFWKDKGIQKAIGTPHGNSDTWWIEASEKFTSLGKNKRGGFAMEEDGIHAREISYRSVDNFGIWYHYLNKKNDRKDWFLFNWLLKSSGNKKKIIRDFNAEVNREKGDRGIRPLWGTHVTHVEKEKKSFSHTLESDTSVLDFFLSMQNRDVFPGNKKPRDHILTSYILQSQAQYLAGALEIKVDGDSLQIPENVDISRVKIRAGTTIEWKDYALVDFLHTHGGYTKDEKGKDVPVRIAKARAMTLMEMLLDGRFVPVEALQGEE